MRGAHLKLASSHGAFWDTAQCLTPCTRSPNMPRESSDCHLGHGFEGLSFEMYAMLAVGLHRVSSDITCCSKAVPKCWSTGTQGEDKLSVARPEGGMSSGVRSGGSRTRTCARTCDQGASAQRSPILVATTFPQYLAVSAAMWDREEPRQHRRRRCWSVSL